MNKDQAIHIIEALFPADSNFQDTAEIGLKLFNQACDEVQKSWRDESEELLIRYAQLCIEEEKRQALVPSKFELKGLELCQK
jgi:hypothetical protein